MKRLSLLALVVAGVSLAGCGVGVSYYAPIAPPPVRVEAYGVAPGPGFVWINGYWAYRGNRYVWVPGYWGRAPRHRSAWVDGRWERRGDRWAYRQGHWR